MKTLIYKQLSKQLLSDWEKLWYKANYANYINSPYWFLSVVKTFQPKDYAIIATYDKTTLVAIGALVKEKRYGVGVYATAPADFVCGLPFLVDMQNKEMLNSFAREFTKVGTIVLDNVPMRDADAIAGAVENTTLTPFGLNFYLASQNSGDGEALIIKRKKLMHRVKGMEKEFVLKTFSGCETEALEKVFEIDNRSSKCKRGYNTFSDKKNKIFYKLLAKKYAEVFKINVLYFRNKPIAYEMGFLISNTYFGTQMAYVEDYSRYCPGKVLAVQLIDNLNMKGVKKLDLGSGDNHLKRSLTKDYSQLYKIIISDNPALRICLRTIYNCKEMAYNLLRENITLYSLYKKLRKIIKI